MVSESASLLSVVRRLHERLGQVSERLRENEAFEPNFKRASRAQVEPGRSSQARRGEPPESESAGAAPPAESPDLSSSGSDPTETTPVASEQADVKGSLSDEVAEALSTEGDQHSSPPEGAAKLERCQVCSELAEELVAYRHGRVCKTCRNILP